MQGWSRRRNAINKTSNNDQRVCNLRTLRARATAALVSPQYAWTNNWIVRAEYLFVDIDHHNVTLTDPVTLGGTGFSFSSTVGEQFSVVRGAVSYKF